MSEEWSPAQRDRAFEEFWRKYPRKVAKHPARLKWAKIVTSRAIFEAIQVYIQRQKATEQWRDIRFVPHASTVLNQRRWEDEPTEPSEALKAWDLVHGHEALPWNYRHQWVCDHEPHCGNRETCAVVQSRVCPHTPACAKRTDCLERIVSQWR